MSEKIQDTNGTPPASALTPEQVRRRIAELRGWKIITFRGGSEVITPDNKRLRYISETGWTRGVPDWPHDPGAALALCLEIARERDTELVMWHEDNPDYGGPLAHFGDVEKAMGSRLVDVHYEDMIADALARLALAALEGGAR